MAPENARSRSGCISCRTRRKKCDEKWDADGSCEKCALSHFVCVRPAKLDIIARRAQRKATAAADGSSLRSVRPSGGSTSSGKSTSPSATAGPSQQQEQQAPLPPPVARQASSTDGSGQQLTSPIRQAAGPPQSSAYAGVPQGQGGQVSFAGPSSAPQPPTGFYQPELSATLPFLNGTASPASLGTPLVQTAGIPPTPNYPPSPDYLSLDFLASFPEFEQLLASQGFAGEPMSTPATPGSFAYPSYGYQPQASGSGAGRGGFVTSSSGADGPGQPVEGTEREDAHFEGALVLKSIGVKERVAHVYNSWNASFLRYLPTDIVESVLHWWDHVCGDSDLTKAASTMCALLFCYRQQRFSRAQKEQIAVVMRQYQSKTLSLVARSKVPFAYALLTYSDLYYYSFDQEGTAAANKFNDLAEQSMVDALGPAPKFNFCAPPGPSHYTMSILVHVAIFRSVAQARPHCFFDLSHDKEDGHAFAPITARALSAPDPPSSASARSLKLFLGLPTELIYAIAMTNNLAGAAASLPFAEVKQQAAEIEARIRGWRPSAEHMGELLDSVQYIEHFRVCEAWRHSALIFLYQAVHRVGCMSELLQTSLRQIIELATPNRAATDDSRFSTGISRAFPWFLAATVAIHPEDRAACREGLEHCGPARAYQDNLTFIRLLWETIDVTGRDPDWREFAKAQGFDLGFM